MNKAQKAIRRAAMKLGNAAGRAVVNTGRGWADVHASSGGAFGPAIAEIYPRWDEFTQWAQKTQPAGTGKTPTHWQAPSPQARQVVAIGANYRGHAAELNLGSDDLLVAFAKFPSCIVGDQANIVLPSSTVDWEVELVAIIGKHTTNVDQESAWNHIAGLTVGQDLTDRALQLGAPGRQYSLSKSFPGAGPTGPYLVTVDELANRNDLRIGCAFGGETKQYARTSQMRRSVSSIVAELSSHITLEPGDLVFTGSPEGSGHSRQPAQYLRNGQLVSWVEGIGTITSNIELTTR